MLSGNLSPSRRTFLRRSLQLSAAAVTLRIATEPMLAAAARHHPFSANGVMIDSNENPLGPSQPARDAMSAILPLGGRYMDNLTDELIHTFAQQEGLNPECVQVFAGSTPALHIMRNFSKFPELRKDVRFFWKVNPARARQERASEW